MLDNSNHEGISDYVPQFKETILCFFGQSTEIFSNIEESMIHLYALMHARYIQTDLGMHQMVIR